MCGYIGFVHLLIIITAFRSSNGLQIILEHSEVTYTNPKYIDWARSSVERHGRTTKGYCLNVEGKIRHVWENNVTFHFLFFENSNGELKKSFVEMHFKYCDMLKSDPYIGKVLAKKGILCPSRAGEYHVMNITVPTERFPNLFPFASGRIELATVVTATGEVMSSGYLDATFKRNKAGK